MIFHTFIHIFHLRRPPRWLDSSVGSALHRYRRGHGFESRLGLNFFQALISQLLKLCVWTATINQKFIFFFTVQTYDLSYIHLHLGNTCYENSSEKRIFTTGNSFLILNLKLRAGETGLIARILFFTLFLATTSLQYTDHSCIIYDIF